MNEPIPCAIEVTYRVELRDGSGEAVTRTVKGDGPDMWTPETWQVLADDVEVEGGVSTGTRVDGEGKALNISITDEIAYDLLRQARQSRRRS